MADPATDPQDPTAIADKAAARALRRLERRGELTPRERAAVERLAERLATEVDALIAPLDGVPNTEGTDRPRVPSN